MILEGKTDTLILEEGEIQESTKMEIDQESHIFLMRMLSKFYSDGIGSLIRETCSNALDSHRECGVNDPIIVGFKQNKDGNYEFSVQDFGCGIDGKDVTNIISKYGKSTKRMSVNQLGAFGLGFKSPLAYTSSFYFVGRKGGIERKWMLYESDDESNKIDLLYESPTTEKNGVKIIVPVKYGDRYSFQQKIKEQLAYFENVYFDCGSDIDNKTVKIVRNDLFQWSSLSSNANLHICLDNVYYPIDFAKLGIGQVQFPIGLRFSLTDGLFPVPNREQLKYTEEAKKTILAKLTLVADYFVNKYNENVKDGDDIFALMDHYKGQSRNVTHLNGTGSLDVRNLAPFTKTKFIQPKLNNIKYLDMKRLYELREYLLYEYNTCYVFDGNKFTAAKKDDWRHKITFDGLSYQTYYKYTELHPLKKAYFRDTIGYKTVKFIRKEKDLKLGNAKYRYTGRGYDNYTSILELWKYPKSEWRERIKELQYVISLITSKFIDADKVEITPEWTENRKKVRLQAMAAKGTNKRQRKLTGEVIGKLASNLERYVSGKNCKFVPVTIAMNKAHTEKLFTIYGGPDSESKIQTLFSVLKHNEVRFVMFSDREMKNLKEIDLHNWMEIGKFMDGKHRIFRRAVTAYLINKLEREYANTFSKIKELKEISAPIAEKVELLSKYGDKYHLDGDKNLYEAMVKVATEKKLFDNTIYDVYKEIQYIFARLPFLEPLFSKMTYSINSGLINAIRDLFKYYKQRIDWKHYHLPITEEVITEILEQEVEELTEKTIEV